MTQSKDNPLTMIDIDDQRRNPRNRRTDNAQYQAFRNLRPLIILSSVVLVVASLYWAQDVLIPIAIAILLTFLLSPIVTSLQRKGLPLVPSVIVVVILTFSVLGAIGYTTVSQVTRLLNDLPRYQDNIKQKIRDLRGASKNQTLQNVEQTVNAAVGEIEKATPKSKRKFMEVVVRDEPSLLKRIPAIIGSLLEPLAVVGLVIVLVIFMLLGRQDLRNRIIHVFGYSQLSVTTKALEEAAERISRYLGAQSIVNAGYGLVVGSALYLIGLPYAVLWGFLAALLRFVPYVGPWIAATMPILASLAVFDAWFWPLVIIGIFLVVELVTNMLVEPYVYGQSAGISEVALLVAVAFWTWLWGPLGLLLATPMTVCLVVIGKYVPRFEPLVVLMGNQSVMEPNIAFYQRLLALDHDEAMQIVEEHLKTEPLEQIYDQILIPALIRAKRDRRHGKLTEDDENFIIEATRDIVEDMGARKPEPEIGSADREIVTQEAPSAVETPFRVLGLPMHNGMDELALLMLKQLLNLQRYSLEIATPSVLTSEIATMVEKEQLTAICIASIPPGGVAQTRNICKRIHGRLPKTNLLIGLWGTLNAGEADDSLLAAGAAHVGLTLLETRNYIMQLASLDPTTEAELIPDPAQIEQDSLLDSDSDKA